MSVLSNSIDVDNEILRVVCGSRLFGMQTSISDHNEVGIFIEPINDVIGFKSKDTQSFRSKPEGVKSGKSDTDLTLYSLRKYVGLAVAGNPDILTTLFAPRKSVLVDTAYGRSLMMMSRYIVSKQAYAKYSGYLTSQKLRISGSKAGHIPARPELVEQYGYDTKYAYHALRLGLQGIELLSTGKLTIPLSAGHREYLMDVRAGEFTLEKVLDDLELLEARLEHAHEVSTIRDKPDYYMIEKYLVNTHVSFWKAKGQL